MIIIIRIIKRGYCSKEIDFKLFYSEFINFCNNIISQVERNRTRDYSCLISIFKKILEMEEAYSNARTKTLIVKLIDIRILLEQWMKLIENVTLHQMEEVTESLNTKEAAAFLSTSSLETEMSNNEEIRLDAIETATESFNYTSDESQTSLEQQSINLSGLYDMIKKQEEAIQKLLLSIAKSKDLEAQITHLKNELLREKRLQKATVEQNKLCKQLENVEYDLQLQKNELNISIQEKLKEQQGLPLKNENLKSRLQTIEKDNYDIAKSATLLENKLFEQNKLQKQIENIEHEFLAQKCKLKFAHVEEKKKLVEEQQRLLSEFVSLQSRINMLEQDKTNITEIITEIIYQQEAEVLRQLEGSSSNCVPVTYTPHTYTK